MAERFKRVPNQATSPIEGEAAKDSDGLLLKKRVAAQLRLLRLGKSTDRSPVHKIPRTQNQIFPLSSGQERILFLQRVESDNRSYQAFYGLQLQGKLDLDALKKSFNEIVRRHEVLRTSFTTKNGESLQKTVPALELNLPIIDLNSLILGEIDLQDWIEREANIPFDVSTAPLLRVTLVRLSETEHVLIYGMHHLISDGWSMAIVAYELSRLYEDFVLGRPSTLQELEFQYGDFVVWQRNRMSNEALRAHLEYWKNQLRDMPVLLKIPSDYSRPAVQSFRGASHRISLRKELTQRLKDVSQKEGATLFMILLAGLKVVLYRYTAATDITVGTPVANRSRREMEELIGFFVSTLPLRTRISGAMTFRDLLKHVREVALAAYEHQDAPFEKIVEAVAPDRSLGHNPLFQVMFGLLNTPQARLNVSGLRFEPVKFDKKTAKFDLEFLLREAEGAIVGDLEYSTDLFCATTIKRLWEHVQNVLEAITVNMDQPIWEIPLLSQFENQEIQAWNSTGRIFGSEEKCLHELFEEQFKRTPNTIAVVCGENQLTYKELNDQADRLAIQLQEAGVGPGVRVGVYAERSLEMVIALYGVLKAGGAYVPLDPTYPKERLRYMINDANAPILLVQAQLEQNLPPHTARLIHLNNDYPGHNRIKPIPRGLPDDLAYVIYTSGSTGQPKGAMNTHRGVCNRLTWMQREYQLREDDSVLQKTPFSFDVSVWEFFWPLLVGARLVLARPEGHQDPDYLARLISAEKITTVHFVPSMLSVFLAAQGLNECHCLKRVICSGEALSKELQDRFFESLPAELHNLYGPTEASIDVTYWSCQRDSPLRTVPIGRPIANTQIYVLDQQMTLLPVQIPGELHIAGVGLGRGYLNRPELTAERFIPLPFGDGGGKRMYRTGDLGRYLASGEIEYLGRMDYQVKLRGLRLELGEIESTVMEHGAVRECVVLAREDEPGEKRLVCYVVMEKVEEGVWGREAAKVQRVVEWEKVFDTMYGGDGDSVDPTFNRAGWNSSYTGEPIAGEEMREWLEDAVGSLRAMRPRRVLEIGCGTGMLLFGLAGECEEYYATDFSQTALKYVEEQVGRLGLSNVHLACRAAHDFEGMKGVGVEGVILNSVVQYFPGVEYLVEVLERVVGSVAAGGFVFIGDVRSLPLQRGMAASVELHKAGEELSVEALREAIEKRIASEDELLIAPEFFLALQKRIPGIGRVEIKPKRCRADNELTRYRYQVVLHIGGEAVGHEPLSWINWSVEKLTLEGLLGKLSGGAAEFGVYGIAHKRLSREVGLLEELGQPNGEVTVGELRQRLNSGEEEGIDPEDLHELAGNLGYDCRVSWARHGAEGSYDVIFQRKAGGRDRLFPGMNVEPRPWKEYANNPLSEGQVRQMIRQLRNHLKEKLPGYMVPAQFVVLERMPLTVNGKTDRQALPEPDRTRPELKKDYVEPVTLAEESLAKIWMEVLGLDRLGRHDNFFDLEGIRS